MSDRYEFTTVCALNQVGDRFHIYDCFHHAGGCAYKDVITVDEAQYQITAYPIDGTVEETGEKLPYLKIEDLQSYFTDKPSETILYVLEKAKVSDIQFVQLVMVDMKEVARGIYQADAFNVTGEGTEQLWYDMPDLVGEDTWDMQEHIIDDAWYSYH